MSCIGKELVIDAARIPIVDVVDSRDLVTSSAILQVGAFGICGCFGRHYCSSEFFIPFW